MTTNNAWNSLNPAQESKGGTNQSTYSKGDLLYASSNDILMKLAIGSDGQILRVSAGGIPAWTTTGTGSGRLDKVSKTFTNTEFKELNSSPVQLLAAQGAGTVIIPTRIYMRLNRGSEDLASGGGVYIVYSGTTTRQCRKFSATTFTSSVDKFLFDTIGPTTDARIPADQVNIPIDLYADGNFTGNASNDATVDVCMWYYTEVI